MYYHNSTFHTSQQIKLGLSYLHLCRFLSGVNDLLLPSKLPLTQKKIKGRIPNNMKLLINKHGR